MNENTQHAFKPNDQLCLVYHHFALICYLVYSAMYGARDEYMNRTLPLVEADQLVRENWEDIPYETVASFGGYVQVLDENNRVVLLGEAQMQNILKVIRTKNC